MIVRSTFQTSDSHKIFESMNSCDCVETTEKTRSPSLSSSGYSSMGSDPNTPNFTPTSVCKFHLSPSAEPYYPKGSPTRIFYSSKQTHLNHSPKVNKTDLLLRRSQKSNSIFNSFLFPGVWFPQALQISCSSTLSIFDMY